MWADGLWGAPSQLSAGNASECESRFGEELRTFSWLRRRGARALWQSNFPIRRHATIGNAVLRAEAECQRAMAERAGVGVVDLWGKVERGELECDAAFHLTHRSAALVARMMLRAFIGQSEGLDALAREGGARETRDAAAARRRGRAGWRVPTGGGREGSAAHHGRLLW